MTGVLDRARGGAQRPASGRRRSTLVVGGGAAVLALGWLIGFSPVFSVRSVQVHGVHGLSRAQVLNVAEVPQGKPLARVNEGAIASRVEQLPAVRAVSVSVSPPSTLTISITERIPVGIVNVGGTRDLVDADDVVFGGVPLPSGLPVVTQYGDGRDRALATVAGQLTAAIRGAVALMDAGSPESVTLHLRDGRTVVWGGTDRAGEKAQLFAAVLTQPGTYFDLSDPGSVISRGAPAPAPTN